MKRIQNIKTVLPFGVVAATAIYLLAVAVPRSDRADDWHFTEVGKLPVMHDGRVMPLDTVARLATATINQRQYFNFGTVDPQTDQEKNAKRYSSIRWLVEAMANPLGKASLYLSVFKVEDPELRQFLGLPRRGALLCSIYDIRSRFQELTQAEDAARAKPLRERSALDLALLEFMDQINAYLVPVREGVEFYDYRILRIENDQVLNLLGMKQRDGLRYSLREVKQQERFDTLMKEAERAFEIKAEKRNLFETKVLDLAHHVRLVDSLCAWHNPLALPPASEQDKWTSLISEIQEMPQERSLPLLARATLLEMFNAYHLGRSNLTSDKKPDAEHVKRFNQLLADYQGELSQQMPSTVFKVRLEAWFNQFAPFIHCAVLYVVVAALGLLSWLVWFRPLNRAALWTMLLIWLVHTGALVGRMWIQGRPPVTNLYSSAIFIGWGCVLTCMVVEYFFRFSLSLIVGSVTGALTLIVAHFLSLDGDTLGNLQAVLDTNFWLATHVVCITFGYTATFVAGFMGIAYILLGVWTPALNRDISDIFTQEDTGFVPTGRLGVVLSKMLYGVVCFAMLLSFVGTVLGGIWADQSWGRFWGWDPKENGALLIVIWNAMILHARWGGLIKQRGLAVLAVLGNCVTAWSYFGTNLLGIGLHAYGFIKGAMLGLVLFNLFMLAVVGIGLLPLRRWKSFQPARPETPVPVTQS